MPYVVTKISRNVAKVHVKYSGELDQEFLLSGDRHWDNPKSDWELQLKHLEQCLEKEAGIIDIGDLFCAMQGKYDKRASKSDVRTEHQCDEYLDMLVETAAGFFAPYANNWIVMGEGNHETKITKNHETNLINKLTRDLNRRTGSKIYNGGYSGWIIFVFENTKTNTKRFVKLWYIHGYGGGGPVTRGVIQSNRKAVYVDADIVLSGHVHDEYRLPIIKLHCSNGGVITKDEQLHLQVSTYKDEYGDGFGGWHVEGGRPPKPIGALWLKFKEDSGGFSFDATRAK